MQGFVAVTDPGWYERLARTPGPKDANFWRPSARAFRLAAGTPFLFKLKAPHNAIAGFGYFAACLERVTRQPPIERGFVARDGGPRFGAPTVHVPRLGQGIFRVQVLDAYGRACAVTEEHSLPVLDAAHIRAYASGGEHAVSNGLALRSDIHRLFDRGYVTVDEELRFVVGRRLKEEFENGRSYYSLHGKPLALPPDAALRPSSSATSWHRERAFLG